MKKLSFLALAAVGLLFGACSDKDEVAQDINSNAVQNLGDAYIGISIELPNKNTPTTRANDDLNNGEGEEFQVNSARLLLFRGENEANAKFYMSAALSTGFEADDKGENQVPSTTKVTSSHVATAKVTDLNLLPSEKLFGYVIINPNGISNPAANTKFSDWADEPFAASTIGSTYDATNKTDKVSSNGLLMTNSPVVSDAGGTDASSGPVVTAVDLTKNLYKSEDEARSNPAGCIFVERAAAKLTISTTGASTSLKEPEDNTTTLAFTINGFQVINTETQYYNTRHVEEGTLGWTSDLYTSGNSVGYASSKAYRFASVDKFAPTIPTTGHRDVYRTYFAKDINYSNDNTGKDNQVATDDGNWIAPTGKAYMPENTFDVEHQTFQNTTCATIKVTFNGGDNIWSVKNDDKLYNDAKIDDAITTKVQALNVIGKWRDAVIAYLAGKYSTAAGEPVTVTVNISAVVTDKSTAGTDKAYTVSYTISAKKTSDDSAYPSAEYTEYFNDLSDKLKSTTDDEGWTKVKASAEGDIKGITLYANGVSYYNVRIQHFGEYETPWNKIDKETARIDSKSPFKLNSGENVAEIYGYHATDATKQGWANKRFLGRYGVVRDNWYQLEIGTISKLGDATPKTVSGDGTPDDQIEEEYWISAHVHILPWVLRTQSVNF